MKIATIIGARPQFIKAAPVSRAIYEYNNKAGKKRTPITEIIIHTGQHFDNNMSDVFFKELDIPNPDYNLGINSANHGAMTGRMLEKIEEVLFNEKPEWVVVYGDTNSTLAGALAAVKLHISVAHVEAGLRSYKRRMPEEINRVLTDHCSNILFCPTKTAVENLRREGIADKGSSEPGANSRLRVVLVGDVMYDAIIQYLEIAEKRSDILRSLSLEPKTYALATVHRPENTDSPERLGSILQGLEQIACQGQKVVIPLHPRTRKRLADLKPDTSSLKLINPVGYLDMLMLEKNARIILTDSGGMQKEAYWFGVPCVTLREETEWVELVNYGCNMIAGSDAENISLAFTAMTDKIIPAHPDSYGDGEAGRRIVEALVRVR